MDTDEGPLGLFAKTLEFGQQLPARACVVRQPSLDVTMANLHLGDAHVEETGSELKGIQPQSSGLARECRRYGQAGEGRQMLLAVLAFVFSARLEKHPRRGIGRRSPCLPEFIAIGDAEQANADDLRLAAG